MHRHVIRCWEQLTHVKGLHGAVGIVNHARKESPCEVRRMTTFSHVLMT